MGPVFSLVLDEDVNDELALRYPELYKDLVKVSLLMFNVKQKLNNKFEKYQNIQ